MIDSHCHLDFDVYDSCRDEVIAEAQAAGVHTLVNIGVDLPSSIRSIELAQQNEGIYATIGIHPHDAKTYNDEVEQSLKDLAGREEVVAIGEIGLDFYRDLSPRHVQEKVFRRQIELAVQLNMPIVIHTRESFPQTLDIVRDYTSDLCGGVFHCFPGSPDEALEVIESGFVISVGGVITFPKAKMARVAAEVPLDEIILETDAPFLTPVPYRGKQNRPAYVRFVYEKLAELRGIGVPEVEKVVDRTAQKLFGVVETFGHHQKHGRRDLSEEGRDHHRDWAGAGRAHFAAGSIGGARGGG
jgi:TatD DNase family protein